MYRRTYEITGYVKDGEVFCPECAEELGYIDGYPVFLGDETDFVLYCDNCGSEIETTVLEGE